MGGLCALPLLSPLVEEKQAAVLDLSSGPCPAPQTHPTHRPGTMLGTRVCLWGDLREGTDVTSTLGIISVCTERCGVRVQVQPRCPLGPRTHCPGGFRGVSV